MRDALSGVAILLLSGAVVWQAQEGWLREREAASRAAEVRAVEDSVALVWEQVAGMPRDCDCRWMLTEDPRSQGIRDLVAVECPRCEVRLAGIDTSPDPHDGEPGGGE